MNAATAWREALASWAIPQPILDAAPEPPWVFPVELFASRADASTATPDVTPSNRRALEALTEGGSVLDVGCGAGAASLPLARRARLLIGVDASADMLAAFAERADAAGVASEVIEGVWPDAAATAPEADVVVCHHVAYNAPYLDAFARALTEHARRRVVMELTATHPLSTMNELWVRFHGLARPDRPTADDAQAVLREAGLEPAREDWVADGSGGFARREDLVAFVRLRLCLPATRDEEIARAIEPAVQLRDGRYGFGGRRVATLWWPGYEARRAT